MTRRADLGLRPSRLSDHMTLFAYDVSELLPATWAKDVARCVEVRGERQQLDGRSSTSRDGVFAEPDEAPATAVVVDGLDVASRLPWLDQLYRGTFLTMANSLDLGGFECAHDRASGINVNAVDTGARYEWHVDSNPLTGVLFLSGPHEGGDLVFRPDGRPPASTEWTERIAPVPGSLLLFDARAAAHRVEPVLGGGTRLSAPMNYYVAGQEQARPDDLDPYLYGGHRER